MKLQLFHKMLCPYSQKVRDFIESSGLREQIEYRDIEDSPDAKDELEKYTQGKQVPCLLINEEPLLESDEIIRWLQKNLLEAA